MQRAESSMAEPRLILRTERYTEGVVVDRDGTLFFSMTALGTISRLRPGAASAEVWAHIPDANGHAIDTDGSHVVMSSTGAILRLDPSGRVVDVVASRVDGRWLTYPNDVALDPHRGGFYVTDSGYKETPKTPPPHPQGRVYRIDRSGIRQVAGGIAYSNGVALSPDGSRLYVSESTARRLWSYGVGIDGTLGEREFMADTPPAPHDETVPDGISLDSRGRLYVANHGAREVLVYDSDGTFVQRLVAGNKATSHVAFARDGRTLYVSGGIEDEQGAGAIYAIAL